MYADDLILFSDSREDLQKQMDKLENYCKQWKLEINNKKTKVMIFNRGNKLINNTFVFKNVRIETVKIFKYLGFTITAKNCSFEKTVEDLSIKANRAIYALNNKIKLSRLHTRLALKLYNSLIAPILLYGAEVWGPFIEQNFEKWDKNKVEQTHTQFIKRALGCNITTSNIMARGEVGSRPLLVDVIIRTISYWQDIQNRQNSIVYEALEYEANNDVSPNFMTFIDKFEFDQNILTDFNKTKIKKTCNDYYERLWKEEIDKSPKALSYKTYKMNIIIENYLYLVKHLKHKIALSRFRLSNHNLLIEKGRHMIPKIERNQCVICKTEIEDELHFLIICPLYDEERATLFQQCRINSIHFDTTLNNQQKFIFIMSNECPIVVENLAKYVFNSFKIRNTFLS